MDTAPLTIFINAEYKMRYCRDSRKDLNICKKQRPAKQTVV